MPLSVRGARSRARRDAPGPETRGIVIPSDMPPQKRTLMPMSGGS
jgi:hypothetical protein